MRPGARGPRLGLQTKVLIPVLAFLVLLPAITLWIVDARMQQEMEDEAQRTLATADSVFFKSLDNRSRGFLAIYRSVVDEARFKVLARLADRKTMEGVLKVTLDDAPPDREFLLYYPAGAGLLASRARGGETAAAAFGAAAEPITRVALEGEIATGNIALEHRAYSVVSVPVMSAEQNLVGALTVGVRLGEAAVAELKLPRTEIILLDDAGAVVSTLPEPEVSNNVLRMLRADPGDAPKPGESGSSPRKVIVGGEHYMARTGPVAPGGTARPSLSYVMLSSYEQRLRALEDTRRTLILFSLAGIILSAATVSWFVRRLTRPLRELRDSTEAIGRGDFSRRLRDFPHDESGELAEAFNRMTHNLESSRAELEKTVETLKATQGQLIQSEKLSAVGQFVAGVAHELNNPLTAMIGFSDLLGETVTDDRTRPYLDIITRSAHRCHKIVDGLLGFARQHAPERTLIDVNPTIEEVLEIMAYDLRTSNITVERDFQPNLPRLLADAHQLQQVYINILSNARQAIQADRTDGAIGISTRLVGAMVHIEFRDSGPGIRAEHLSRIFDPFFTTKVVGKGTGLGMSLSYGIIREHGGKISVRSEYGHGAAFLIELPLGAETTGEGPARETNLPRTEVAAAGKSVLVVDDEEWILNLSEALLARQGYDVRTANNGEAALIEVKSQRFDVVICDWKMPGLSGIQFYERLAALDPVAASRMLFMTGDVISDTFQNFLSKHSRTCLNKPFAIEDFRRAVADMATAAAQ